MGDAEKRCRSVSIPLGFGTSMEGFASNRKTGNGTDYVEKMQNWVCIPFALFSFPHAHNLLEDPTDK
jgi:hypothetical protein